MIMSRLTSPSQWIIERDGPLRRAYLPADSPCPHRSFRTVLEDSRGSGNRPDPVSFLLPFYLYEE